MDYVTIAFSERDMQKISKFNPGKEKKIDMGIALFTTECGVLCSKYF